MLAKGRATLAAKASAPAVQGDEPAAPASSGRKVEVVKLAKASGGGTKASPKRSPARPHRPAAPKTEPAKESRGVVGTVIDWLSST